MCKEEKIFFVYKVVFPRCFIEHILLIFAYAKIGHVNQSTLRSCLCYFWINMILSLSHKTMRFSALLLPYVGICCFFVLKKLDQ